MSKTLQTQYIEALERLGEKTVKRGRKYTTLTRSKTLSNNKPITNGRASFWFIGVAGSVRYGRIYTQSVPLGDNLRAALISTEITL